MTDHDFGMVFAPWEPSCLYTSLFFKTQLCFMDETYRLISSFNFQVALTHPFRRRLGLYVVACFADTKIRRHHQDFDS